MLAVAVFLGTDSDTSLCEYELEGKSGDRHQVEIPAPMGEEVNPYYFAHII